MLTIEQLAGIILDHVEDTSIHSGEGGGGSSTPTEPTYTTAEVEEMLERWEAACDTIVANLTANPNYYGNISLAGITSDNAMEKYMTVIHNAIHQALTSGLTSSDVDDLIEAYLTDNSATILAGYIKSTDAAFGSVTVANLFASVGTFLSAISTTLSAQDVQSFKITSDHMTIANSFITNAMIANLNASKITAGTLSTGSVTISSDDSKMVIADGTITISDGTLVRVQIGEDSNNDYNMVVRDANGNVMWSALGIQAAAIKSAIINDAMVANDANISASKINISSLVTAINTTGGLTMNAADIIMDTNNQKLSAWFNTMNTWKGAIGDDVDTLETSISVIQGQLSTFASASDVTTLQTGYSNLSSQYTSLNQTVSGLSSTVSSQTTTIQTLSNDLDTAEGTLSTLGTTVSGISDDLDTAQGTLSTLGTTVSGISDDLDTAESNIGTLQSTVSGLSTSVTTAQSNITTLQTTATGLNTRVSSLESQISQVSSGGGLTESEVEEIVSEQIAELSMTATQIRAEISSTIATAVNGTYVTHTELNQWITFDATGLTIGSDNSDVKLAMSNSQIQFQDSSDNELATWTGSQFHAPNLTVNADEFIKLGHYKFIPMADGTLILRYES